MKKMIIAFVVGAVLLIGLQNAHAGPAEDGAVAGAVVGATTGLVVGYLLGNELNQYDEDYIDMSLNEPHAPAPAGWTNPDTHMRHHITPGAPHRGHDGRMVRDVNIQTRMPNGHVKTEHARAHQQPNGKWSLDRR